MFWILLSNLLVFQGIYFAEDSERWADQQMYDLLVLFVVDSGLPIFTLLFGYAVVKLYESVHQKGKKSRWIFLRRAAGLYALGVCHSFLFESDILRTYGLLLLYLIPLVRMSAKWLVVLLIVCYGLNVSLFFLEGIFQSVGMDESSYAFLGDALFLLILTPIPILPMMVLGMILAKWHVFAHLQKERKWYVVGTLLVPIGLVVKYAANVNPYVYLFDTGELLALGYVFFIALVCSYAQTVPYQHIFNCVGRLSLTNYLMQSLICVTVFVYLDVGNTLGALGGVLFGVVLYSVQCVISVYYLKHFKRGPFEMLLRIVTNWSWRGQLR